MTIGFSQEIKGVKNYFVEKIWLSFREQYIIDFYRGFNERHLDIFAVEFDKPFFTGPDGGDIETYPNPSLSPKLHTIRQGLNRWRAGMDIHMVINNRTSNRFQFAPTIKCKSVQKIEIKWIDQGTLFGRVAKVYIDDTKRLGEFTEIDKTFIISPHRNYMEKLAINDGFDSIEDFFAYFNKDFTGTLIHWTDLKY